MYTPLAYRQAKRHTLQSKQHQAGKHTWDEPEKALVFGVWVAPCVRRVGHGACKTMVCSGSRGMCVLWRHLQRHFQHAHYSGTIYERAMCWIGGACNDAALTIQQKHTIEPARHQMSAVSDVKQLALHMEPLTCSGTICRCGRQHCPRHCATQGVLV